MSAAAHVAPLHCKSCGAAVPLADAEHFACPYCAHGIPVPAKYRALFETAAAERETRAAAERAYARVAAVPSGWFDLAAGALVIAGPALAAAAWIHLAAVRPTVIALFAFAIVPGLAPGSAMSLWSAALHATMIRVTRALASTRAPDAKGELCRHCGAPLPATAEDALAAHCAYCGTDSLVGDPVPATARLADARSAELRTLGDAAAALRARRRFLAIGTVAGVAVFAALAIAVAAAYAHLAV